MTYKLKYYFCVYDPDAGYVNCIENDIYMVNWITSFTFLEGEKLEYYD